MFANAKETIVVTIVINTNKLAHQKKKLLDWNSNQRPIIIKKNSPLVHRLHLFRGYEPCLSEWSSMVTDAVTDFTESPLAVAWMRAEGTSSRKLLADAKLVVRSRVMKVPMECRRWSLVVVRL